MSDQHDPDETQETQGNSSEYSQPGEESERVRNSEDGRGSDEDRDRGRHRRGRHGHGRRHRRHRHRERRGSRERKERVLHTRISEQLSEDIRAMADDLRVPVSNLVRNVLEEAFSVAEQVSDDLGGVFEDVMDGAERASRQFERFRARHEERAAAYEADPDTEDAEDAEIEVPPAPPAPQTPPPPAAASPPPGDLFEGIVAWQPVVLHAPQYCARSGVHMPAGTRAYAAIGSHGLTGLYVQEEALPVD